MSSTCLVQVMSKISLAVVVLMFSVQIAFTSCTASVLNTMEAVMRLLMCVEELFLLLFGCSFRTGGEYLLTHLFVLQYILFS